MWRPAPILRSDTMLFETLIFRPREHCVTNVPTSVITSLLRVSLMTLRPRTHGRTFNILCRIHTYILRYATISISNYRRIVYYSVYNARRPNDTINIKGCRSRARAREFKGPTNVIIIILIMYNIWGRICTYYIVYYYKRFRTWNSGSGSVWSDFVSRFWNRTRSRVNAYTVYMLNNILILF